MNPNRKPNSYNLNRSHHHGAAAASYNNPKLNLQPPTPQDSATGWTGGGFGNSTPRLPQIIPEKASWKTSQDGFKIPADPARTNTPIIGSNLAVTQYQLKGKQAQPIPYFQPTLYKPSAYIYSYPLQ